MQCYCFWARLFEHLWAVRMRMTLCCRSHPPPRLHRSHIPPSHKELGGGGRGAALSTTGGSNFILHIVKIVHCWNISTLLNLDSMAWSYLWGVSFCQGLCNILFQPTSALPELEEQGNQANSSQHWGRAADFQAEEIWLTILEKYIWGIFFYIFFFNMYEARQDILRLNSVHL